MIDIADLPSKKRRFENGCDSDLNFTDDLDKSDFIQPTNAIEMKNGLSFTNGQILSRFLDRLKLKTTPHIFPLIQRLHDAENKNSQALKAIEKINKRIKELEDYVEKNRKPSSDTSVSVGTDLTDPNSEEYMRIMKSIQSTPKVPMKPPSSQGYRMQQQINKTTSPVQPVNISTMSIKPIQQLIHQSTNSMIDLTSEEIALAPNSLLNTIPIFAANLPLQAGLSNIPLQTLPVAPFQLIQRPFDSAQYLPKGPICQHFGAPKLTWKKSDDGINLEWNMVFNNAVKPTSYQIYSYQKSEVVSQGGCCPWKLIGNTEALQLPMACTLKLVVKQETYYFSLRASASDQTFSPWSNVVTVELN